MKTGIYLSGLARGYTEENVYKYAARLMHELDANNEDPAVKYRIERSKIEYGQAQLYDADVIDIWACKDKQEECVYRFYEFFYSYHLAEQYIKASLIKKVFLIFLSFTSKLSVIIRQLFIFGRKERYLSFTFRFQSFMLITTFIFITFLALLIIPTGIGMASEIPFSELPGIKELINIYHNDISPEWKEQIPQWSKDMVKDFPYMFKTKIFPLVTILFLIFPAARTNVPEMASDFVGTNNYLDSGEQRQFIHGKLDMLVEHIYETQGADTKLHFHAYSFGSIIAIDYLFPYGNALSKRIQHSAQLLVTVGCPYDFVRTYYSSHFKGERNEVKDLLWYNVNYPGDILGSNFRKDTQNGDSEYGIGKSPLFPKNIYYSVTYTSSSFISFFKLYGLRAHQMYWSSNPDGQSCLRLILGKMKEDGFV